ncbi:MAG: hypothetical protein HY809_04465 [Nitrospirae bacterium]|nr:hypothetical protein [Nitrospirota bacterium]
MKPFETLLTAILRLPVLGEAAEGLAERLHRVTVRAMRRARRNHIRAREWSNDELRKVAGFFDGAVINVSGWRDEDKTGGLYRDYFSKASSYTVSNFSGRKGSSDGIGDVFIDLEGEVPPDLRRRYQAAFSHTTLEHIYDIRRGIANICSLSHDSVILVTPFLQAVHDMEGSFGDFWRPTPMCISRMLEEEGFETIYQSSNDNPWHVVYVFTVASRKPGLYKGRLPSFTQPQAGARHFKLF